MKPHAAWVLTVLLLTGAPGALAQSVRLAGDVVSLEGNSLTLKPARGSETKVVIADTARVNVRFPVDIAQVAPGAFVGAMSLPQPDGTLRVTALQVFPESARGTGEGHRPMETDPGNTMTNATVAKVVASRTETNATVTGVGGTEAGPRVTVTYKGGEQVLIVPPGTPVYSSAPGDRTLLVPGAHIVVFGRRNPDGVVVAERFSVGKDGYVPPL